MCMYVNAYKYLLTAFMFTNHSRKNENMRKEVFTLRQIEMEEKFPQMGLG